MFQKWETLPVNWKWRLLIFALLLFFYGAYIFNIKRTIGVTVAYYSNTYTPDTGSTAFSGTWETDMSQLIQEDTNDDNSLINMITAICDTSEVEITSLEQSRNKNYDKLMVESFKVQLKGKYISLLHLINILEKQRIALLSAAVFELKATNGTEIQLYATVYINQIRYEEHD